MAKKSKIYILLLPIWFATQELPGAISIVYNLRIAESTRKAHYEKIEHPYSVTTTGFDTERKKANFVHQNAGGMLYGLSYTTSKFYVHADLAWGKVQERRRDACGNVLKKEARTQSDDILFHAGYSFDITDRIRLGLSGIFGIPTHKQRALEMIQFGYGHIGIGVQGDGSFNYTTRNDHSFRSIIRYIYFVPRETKVTVENKPRFFDYHLGNIIDILTAHHFRFGFHRFEFGLDTTFWFGAKIFPFLADAVAKTNYTRIAPYANYKYRFEICNVHQYIATGFSYAVDFPKEFANNRILTAWAAWQVSF